MTFEQKLDASPLPGLFKAVIAVLYEHSPRIFPKQKSIADYCGCKRIAVSRVLGAAEELGVIRRIKDRAIGRGKFGPMTRYVVDTDHSVFLGEGIDEARVVITRWQRGLGRRDTQETFFTSERKVGSTEITSERNYELLEGDTSDNPRLAQRAQGYHLVAPSRPSRNYVRTGWDFDEEIEVMGGTTAAPLSGVYGYAAAP